MRVFAVVAATVAGSELQIASMLTAMPELSAESLLQTLDRSSQRLASSGRRRMVQDTDCDDVVDEADVIERTCSGHRYHVFSNIWPQVDASGTADANMVDRTSNLNDTFTGGIFAMDIGIRSIFDDQRAMLYGPGGTCLAPRAGGLSVSLDRIGITGMKLFSQIRAILDTHWSNLVPLDKFMSSQFLDHTMVFSNVTATVLATMNDFQARLAKFESRANVQLTTDLNGNITQVSTAINAVSESLDKLLIAVEKDGVRFHADVDPKMDALLDTLDTLSTQFSNADDMFADVITQIATKANPILTAVPEKEAMAPISSARTQIQAAVDDLSASSLASVKNSKTDWARSLEDATKTNGFDRENAESTIADGNAAIEERLNRTESGLDVQTSDFGTATRKKLSDLTQAVKDVRNTVWVMSSKLNNAKGSLQTIFSALDGVAGSAAEDIRSRISALLSASGDVSAESLKSVLQAVTELQRSTTSSGSESDIRMAAAVANVRDLVGKAGLTLSNTASDTQGALSSQADYSTRSVDTTNRRIQTVVTEMGSSAEHLADGTSGSVADAATQYRSSRQEASDDIANAFGAYGEAIGAATAASQLEAKQTKRAVISNMAGEAEEMDVTATSASTLLKRGGAAASSAGSAVTNVAGSLYSSSQQTSKSASKIEDDIAGLDDHVADSFGAETTGAFAVATDKADREQASAMRDLDARTSELVNGPLGEILGQLGQTSDAAKAAVLQKLAATDDASSDLFELHDLLAGAVRGSNGQLDEKKAAVVDAIKIAISKALGSVQSVSPQVAAAASQSEAAASSETAKVTAASLAEFRKSVGSILSDAESASMEPEKFETSFHDNVYKLSEARDRLRTKVASGFDAVAAIEGGLKDGGELSAGETTIPLREAIVRALGALDRNITGLEGEAMLVGAGAPGKLPESFEEGIKAIFDSIVKDADAVASSTADSVEAVAAGARKSARGTMGLLGDLDATNQQWESQYGEKYAGAMASSRDRVGDLSSLADNSGGVANLISALQGGRGKVMQESVSLADASDMDMQKLVATVMTSVRVAKGALNRTASSGGSQAAFDSKLNDGKAGKLLQALKVESELSSQASADTAAALSDTTGRAGMDIRRIESDLAADQQKRESKLAKALGQVGGMDSEFVKNITGNKDATAVQLMMAKRSIRDLLKSWADYATFETGKFRKMARVDEEYERMSEQHLAAADADSSNKLSSSEQEMDLLNADVANMIEDYLKFSASTDSQLGLLSSVVPTLNTTAQLSIGQISESAFAFDRSDGDLDEAARNSSLTAIEDFEASLDYKAKIALDGIKMA